MWRHEYKLFRQFPKKVRLKYRAEGIREKSSIENIVAGVKWRLDMFDVADANKDGRLDLAEYIAFYRA